ncbi:MAG: hypothetical protein ACLFU0_02210, partial [Alphaproteobacteria bacterium]
FALFDRLAHRATLPPVERPCTLGPWRPTVTPEAYRAAIGRIKEWIAAGDTYQVNYTHRLHSRFTGEPEALFARLYAAQRAGGDRVTSASRPRVPPAPPVPALG